MINLEHSGQPLCDGISRREFLRVGGLGPLALSLPGFYAGQAQAASARPRAAAKRCIQIFLWGGPGAQETWDLKPGAPVEVRGEFQPIGTTVDGLQICEHMPLLARRAHRYSLVRSCTHTGINHGTSAYHMLTGHIHFDPGTLRRPTKGDMPNLGINASRFLAHPPNLPACVKIPHPIWDGGVTEVPGQRPGLLGDRFEPFRVTGDLTEKEFRPEVLRMAPGVDNQRLSRRAGLLEAIEQRSDYLRWDGEGSTLSVFYEKAFNLLSSPETYRAFDLASEPAKTRERYGMHWFGQSLCLARRLIEAGVPLVTVYWNTPALTVDESWDTHADQHRRMKDCILPPFDKGLAALLDELTERGLFDETLVTWYGEFGRTPKINRKGGRDHWGFCQSIGFAGGGIRGGVVHGSSTPDGGYAHTDPVTPDDVAATVFHCLGVNPHQMMHDVQQRPIPLSYGEPIRAILG